MRELVVMKVGGSLGGKHLDAVTQALYALAERHAQAVLVHGGGPRITAALREASIESEFIQGQRVTSPTAMEVVERVLAVEVNRELVAALATDGISVRGLSGGEGILLAEPIPDLMRVGRVTKVNPDKVMAALESSVVPVVAPIGCDETGLRYNINADLAASALAAALHARRIVFLTDVPGIYSDFEAGELLCDATLTELCELRAAGRFSTGMIPKVEAVEAALTAGVGEAFVVHGGNPRAVFWALTCNRDGAAGERSDGGELLLDCPEGTRVTLP